ncbi:hypothetical protein CIK05_13165 [Bdellovibrio sp. qaytius]|nr:hypothetical protein CIK05_13165 [Bdellovibrio sp. qaytius]
MNLKIIFHFLIGTLITLMGQLTFAAPAGFRNFHGLGKTAVKPYLAPVGLHTCALTQLGWINCWGANNTGQIGNNTQTESNKQIPIRSGIIQISTARSGPSTTSGTTFAITLTGVLMSWGDNLYGKLGTGTSGGASFTPQIVDVTNRYKFISSQYGHVCAITSTDVLKCWGYNSDGQVGDNTLVQKNSPVTVDAGVSYKFVAVGASFTCAITTAGVLKCWGLNDTGQVGDNTLVSKTTPVVINSGTTYDSVSLGYSHACGVTTAGVLKCWGSDTVGQMGDGGLPVDRYTPNVVDSGVNYSSVSTSNNTSCAITTTGILKCWGENDNGEIGDGSTANRTLPVTVDSGTSYASVSMGGDHTCGVTTAKVAKCWGLNDHGQLGLGTTGGFQSTPQSVVNP